MSSLPGRALRATAPVLVLVMLAGLLLMHVLAGGSHAAHAMAMPPSTAAVEHGPAVLANDYPVVQAPTAASGVTTVCVLALLATGLLLAPPRRAGLLLAAVPGGLLPGRRRTRAPGRGPPRDLLAELCVLRT